LTPSTLSKILPPKFESMPDELTSVPHWILWMAEPSQDGTRWNKIPYDAKNPRCKASSTDPATWAPFEVARRAYEENTGFAGVGFVLSDDDPFTGIDLDHVIDESRCTSPVAQVDIDALDTYTEVSPSGTGVRMFAKALKPEGKCKSGDTEIYAKWRFLTVTGRRLKGTPATVNERQEEVNAFHAKHYPAPAAKRERVAPTTILDLSDADIVEKARNSKQGAKFLELYGGGYAGLPGHSEADISLCSILAFWTQGDPVRIDRIFRTSGLMRDKWDEQRGANTYGERTIESALATVTEFYTPPVPRDPARYLKGSFAPSDSEPLVKQKRPELDPDALHGLAGDLVNTILPCTEADPVGLLIATLTMFGNLVGLGQYGRGAHFHADGVNHYGNLYACIVGDSMTGKKGTAWANIRNVFKEVSPEWSRERIEAGLSSGEGLIQAVRDKDLAPDEVDDKRLMVNEGEFANVLRVIEREGNTLSAKIREAWDNGNISSLTRRDPLKATGAHISIFAQITPDEVLRLLNKTETANGFGNRFLWLYVERSKLLPEGEPVAEETIEPLIQRLKDAVLFAQRVGRMKRDENAAEIWRAVYGGLNSPSPGIAGKLTTRGTPQVMRIALLYALLDHSTEIREEHLGAALALWDYCLQSVRYIFGDATGDPIAETILQALRNAPEGLSQTEVSSALGRNVKAEALGSALSLLEGARMITSEKVTPDGGKGKPTIIWKLTT
jgi:hypothetical protein